MRVAAMVSTTMYLAFIRYGERPKLTDKATP
jgi:hypothetical protein